METAKVLHPPPTTTEHFDFDFGQGPPARCEATRNATKGCAGVRSDALVTLNE
jgi:hypothetical protein